MLKLEILTPNGIIYDGNAITVTLPGEEGEFGVLAEHSTVATLLKAGVIDIEKEDKTTESVVVNWGVVQVDEKKVVVLVDVAVIVILVGVGVDVDFCDSSYQISTYN